MNRGPSPQRSRLWLASVLVVVACQAPEFGAPAAETAGLSPEGIPVAQAQTTATTTDGSFISWSEHIIDDESVGGVPIRGGDGLVMADLDLDGHLDIVSVHESHTQYDGFADGHVRVAFGSKSPERWELATLAEEAEAGAAEDMAVADANGDGYPDLIVACELAHLLYLQNPCPRARSARWERVIPAVARDRGSFIRAFFADLDGDGRPEVLAANKGEQNPDPNTTAIHAISRFEIIGDPLEDSSWIEHELSRVPVPINSQPVDLDGDGDMDVVAGSRGERRILWFENEGGSPLVLTERTIQIDASALGFDGAAGEAPRTRNARVTGFNLDFTDLSGVTDPLGRLAWFEHPDDPRGAWIRHDISRRKRGMFDKFVPRDMDGDGDVDFVGTRGNSVPFDGVFWLEEVRSAGPVVSFQPARALDSEEVPLAPSRR